MELILSIIDAGGYSSSTIMDDVATPFTMIHRSSYDEILELCNKNDLSGNKILSSLSIGLV